MQLQTTALLAAAFRMLVRCAYLFLYCAVSIDVHCLVVMRARRSQGVLLATSAWRGWCRSSCRHWLCSWSSVSSCGAAMRTSIGSFNTTSWVTHPRSFSWPPSINFPHPLNFYPVKFWAGSIRLSPLVANIDRGQNLPEIQQKIKVSQKAGAHIRCQKHLIWLQIRNFRGL
jgi:hypothetical protein